MPVDEGVVDGGTRVLSLSSPSTAAGDKRPGRWPSVRQLRD